MERQPITGLTLYYDPRERDTADLIAGASRKTLLIVREHLRDRCQAASPDPAS